MVSSIFQSLTTATEFCEFLFLIRKLYRWVENVARQHIVKVDNRWCDALELQCFSNLAGRLVPANQNFVLRCNA
jgi:hypothetical protein